MKEVYEKPTIEVVIIERTDIITASGVGVEWNSEWGNDWNPYQN